MKITKNCSEFFLIKPGVTSFPISRTLLAHFLFFQITCDCTPTVAHDLVAMHAHIALHRLQMRLSCLLLLVLKGAFLGIRTCKNLLFLHLIMIQRQRVRFERSPSRLRLIFVIQPCGQVVLTMLISRVNTQCNP